MALINATMALGGGARLGSWGLRQTKTIIEDIPEVIQNDNGLFAVFYSPSGEQVANLISGYGEGKRLQAELKFSKLGGLKTFNIELLRNNRIPLFNGINVRLYWKNKPFSYGYINKIPPSEQTDSVIKLSGVGYSKKLDDKVITESYTSTTDTDIIKDIASTYFLDLGINYNPTKIVAAGLTYSQVSWEDKSITKILMDIVKAANNDYENIQFIYGVDEYGDFYFQGIQPQFLKNGYYEGYQFQNPSVKNKNNKMVNQIKIYRTNETTGDVEYVDTVSNDDSIENYGLFEDKLTVADFVDNTTAGNIAYGIVKDKGQLKKELEIEDLKTDSLLPFGYYNVATKPQTQSITLSEFNDKDDWFITTPANVEIETDNVFTGRKCFKWKGGSLLGERLRMEKDIYSPKIIRLYVRQGDTGEKIILRIRGLKSQDVPILETDTARPVVTDIPAKILMQSETPAHDDTEFSQKIYDNHITGDWVNLDFNISDYFKINRITIQLNENITNDILLDRLEVFTESYITNTLALEEVSYEFGSTFLKCGSVVFGDRPDTLTDDLKDVNEKTDISLNIFSKE